jgi:hypothetical protein
MSKLKSLSDFEMESSVLEKKQMQSITGGSTQTEYYETCNNNVEDTRYRGRKDYFGEWGNWGSWMYSDCTRHQMLTSTC